MPTGQDILRPASNPFSPSGGVVGLKTARAGRRDLQWPT